MAMAVSKYAWILVATHSPAKGPALIVVGEAIRARIALLASVFGRTPRVARAIAFISFTTGGWTDCHEQPSRFHHAARRRGSGVAARGTGASLSDATGASDRAIRSRRSDRHPRASD